MKKIIIGDIFELETGKGKAYLHYVHNDETIGQLIRVLDGIYPARPANLHETVSKKERYFISFPLIAAFRKKIIEHIGYYSASSFSKPAFMRIEHNIRGEFLGWHIIDTDTWKRELVKSLSPAQKELSPWGCWNDTLLIERLNSDWNLQNWE